MAAQIATSARSSGLATAGVGGWLDALVAGDPVAGCGVFSGSGPSALLLPLSFFPHPVGIRFGSVFLCGCSFPCFSTTTHIATLAIAHQPANSRHCAGSSHYWPLARVVGHLFGTQDHRCFKQVLVPHLAPQIPSYFLCFHFLSTPLEDRYRFVLLARLATVSRRYRCLR